MPLLPPSYTHNIKLKAERSYVDNVSWQRYIKDTINDYAVFFNSITDECGLAYKIYILAPILSATGLFIAELLFTIIVFGGSKTIILLKEDQVKYTLL